MYRYVYHVSNLCLINYRDVLLQIKKLRPKYTEEISHAFVEALNILVEVLIILAEMPYISVEFCISIAHFYSCIMHFLLSCV
jgi:hypothetical protein